MGLEAVHPGTASMSSWVPAGAGEEVQERPAAGHLVPGGSG